MLASTPALDVEVSNCKLKIINVWYDQEDDNLSYEQVLLKNVDIKPLLEIGLKEQIESKIIEELLG